MRKHKQPSDKQLKAIALRAANPRMSLKEVALQAGYSPSTAHVASKNIFNKPLVQTWLDNYRYTIEKAGLTQARVAEKLNELLDNSDARVQLKTIEVYNDIFGVKNNDSTEKNTQGLKRRMTLEEFEDKEGAQT